MARYFDERVEAFEKKYEWNPPGLQGLARRFRRSMTLRFERTVGGQVALEGKTVMDIGCGTGRYVQAFLELGAARVIAVDVSEEMLSHVRERLGEEAGRCTTVHGDFLETDIPEEADVCVAMGFFDYVMQPLPYLEKIRRMTREKVLASFPVKDWLWPQRWLRYRLRGCPIRSYTEAELKALFTKAGYAEHSVERLERDFYVEALIRG